MIATISSYFLGGLILVILLTSRNAFTVDPKSVHGFESGWPGMACGAGMGAAYMAISLIGYSTHYLYSSYSKDLSLPGVVVVSGVLGVVSLITLNRVGNMVHLTISTLILLIIGIGVLMGVIQFALNGLIRTS